MSTRVLRHRPASWETRHHARPAGYVHTGRAPLFNDAVRETMRLDSRVLGPLRAAADQDDDCLAGLVRTGLEVAGVGLDARDVRVHLRRRIKEQRRINAELPAALVAAGEDLAQAQLDDRAVLADLRRVQVLHRLVHDRVLSPGERHAWLLEDQDEAFVGTTCPVDVGVVDEVPVDAREVRGGADVQYTLRCPVSLWRGVLADAKRLGCSPARVVNTRLYRYLQGVTADAEAASLQQALAVELRRGREAAKILQGMRREELLVRRRLARRRRVLRRLRGMGPRLHRGLSVAERAALLRDVEDGEPVEDEESLAPAEVQAYFEQRREAVVLR